VIGSIRPRHRASLIWEWSADVLAVVVNDVVSMACPSFMMARVVVGGGGGGGASLDRVEGEELNQG